MEEKSLNTILLEKEVEQKVETKITQPAQKIESLKINLTELKQKSVQTRSEIQPEQKVQKRHRIVDKKEINFFGGEVKKEEPIKHEVQANPIQARETSSAIETPNYDLMQTLSESQEKKIFKIEKQEKQKRRTSPLLRRLKIAIFVLMFGILGSWTVFNAVQLSNVVTEYNLKLDQYLLKLATLDSASNMNDLFPTYPEESSGASSIESKSNWFDRLCNFIAGIFGG